MESQYSLVVVGTGFASAFFLSRYLESAGARDRVLVLERGRRDELAWQLANRRNSSTDPAATFVNGHDTKEWVYTPAFGGGSNCWWAATPRFMPNDFRLHSEYGVGSDWPLDYAELEPFYERAEAIMSISGGDAAYPRRTPPPQPPHRMNEPDLILADAFPGAFFHQPTARARVATPKRPACCATGVCKICPVGAKFSVARDMDEVFSDPRVTLLFGATAERVETNGDVITGIHYAVDGTPTFTRADLVVLGANALFNPFILQRSGIDHPLLGRGLHEQVSVTVDVDLDGLENYQGSTSITGHGYLFYDGPHRSERPACLVETFNVPRLRAERGRYLERMRVKLIFEDLPRQANRVAASTGRGALPETFYEGHSAYAQRGLDAAPGLVEKLLAPLPVERVHFPDAPNTTEAHILGTTPMGDDPKTSVADRYGIHHRVRNLVLLGSGLFPSGSPANPTLTLSALALRTADHLAPKSSRTVV